MSIVAISKKAGVSIATVSRVMNNHPSVSPEIATLVRRVVAENNYTIQPRQKRRQPEGKRLQNKSVALLFPDPSAIALKTVLSGRLSFGIHHALAEQRANMVICSLADWDRLPDSIMDGAVDAVIVRGTVPITSFIEQIRPLPCVTVFETFGQPEIGDQVLDDSALIGELACNYLRSRGCTRLAVVGRDPLHPAYSARADAFVRSARFSGCEVESFVAPAPFKEICQRVLSRSPRVQGVFVSGGDDDVTGIFVALGASGVAVGSELKFISTVYDPAILRSLDPGLDYIDIEPEAIGRAAVEMLVWRLDNVAEPIQRRLIQPRLVQREPQD